MHHLTTRLCAPFALSIQTELNQTIALALIIISDKHPQQSDVVMYSENDLQLMPTQFVCFQFECLFQPGTYPTNKAISLVGIYKNSGLTEVGSCLSNFSCNKCSS